MAEQALPAEGSIERRVLDALRGWIGIYDAFCPGDDVLVRDDAGIVTHDQMMSALSRLRKKGLVNCVYWRDRQYVWYPTKQEEEPDGEVRSG